MRAEGQRAKSFTPATIFFKKKSTNNLSEPLIKLELVINPSLDQIMVKLNEVTVIGLESIVNQLKDQSPPSTT